MNWKGEQAKTYAQLAISEPEEKRQHTGLRMLLNNSTRLQ